MIYQIPFILCSLLATEVSSTSPVFLKVMERVALPSYFSVYCLQVVLSISSVLLEHEVLKLSRFMT
jgi:hypothetical protein